MKSAEKIRDHLRLLGLSQEYLNLAFNGVWIKAAYHRTIHTATYVLELEQRLLNKTNADDAIDEIIAIGEEIMDEMFRYK